MAGRIILTADSTCDLNEELIKRYDIKIIPFHVILNEEEYLDNIDITSDDIFDNYKKTSNLPKTAAISVGEFIAFFRQWLNNDNQILHISISSAASSAYQNSKIASEILGENVFCYDTHSLSTGMGMVAIKAGEMIASQMGIDEILRKLDDIRDSVSISFMIDTMEYLKAGGRCSSLAALGANMLKIHPCIEVNPQVGSMAVCKKYRGVYLNVIKQYVNDRLGFNITEIDDSIIFITYPQTDEAIWKVADEEIRKLNYFKQIHHTKTSCTVSSHCGPNTLGIIFLRKK